MLENATVFATIAVKDLDEGKQFYGTTLGLKQVDENPGGVTFESGGSRLFVYPAPSAGTNQATSASWKVDDVDAAVDELKAKGIKFEHYDMPGGTWDGDVISWGDMKSAWFKDPSGNTLCVASA